MMNDAGTWPLDKAMPVVQAAARIVDPSWTTAAGVTYPWVWILRPSQVAVWIRDRSIDVVEVELVIATPGVAQPAGAVYSWTICETAALFAAHGSEIIATGLKALLGPPPGQP